MLRFFKKKDVYEYSVDPKVANDILQNVFHAAGCEPNITPFEKLVKRKQNVFHLWFAYLLGLTAILFTLCIPLFFISSSNDNNAPVIEDYYMEGTTLWLSLSDIGSGVDFDKIYAKQDDFYIFTPSTIDKKKKLVSFTDVSGTLDLYVSDFSGNTTHALLTYEEE